MKRGCKKNLNKNQLRYMIKIQGVVDESWSDWFSGMDIQTEIAHDGTRYSLLRGSFADQATLRGVLNNLWDLNATLIEVNRIDDQGISRN